MSLLRMFGLVADSPKELGGDPFDDKYYNVDPGTGYAYLGRTLAGVSVNEYLAMTYSGCWAASMLLMTAIGGLPLKLMRARPDGGSEPDKDDPRYDLMHDEPNPDSTDMMFRASLHNHQINWGNGFAEIERTKGGMPAALHRIHPSRIPPENIVRRSGRLWYLVNNNDGTRVEIPGENMLHVPSPMSDDGIIGKGVIQAARLQISGGMAAETHAAAYFGNNARPSFALEGAKFRKAEEAEAFRNQWMEVHGGPRNSSKPAILPPDTKMQAFMFNAQDAQFLESRQWSIEDIARFYGVPPHSIGHLLRATNNNIEQQALELKTYALMRWTIPLEKELRRKLLSKPERKTMFFTHIFEGLERADLTTRTNALKEQFFNGEITLNEWRAIENRPPIGPLGDLHFVQSAMVPLDIAAQGPPKPAPPGQPPEEDETKEPPEDTEEPKDDGLSRIADVQQKLAKAMLRDAMARMVSVEINNVKRIAEKPNKFFERLDEFYAKHEATMTRSLTEPVEVYLSATADSRQPLEVVRSFTSSYVSDSRERLISVSECQPEELFAKVEECVSTWHEERAVMV